MGFKKEYWQTLYDVKSWLGIHVSHHNYTRNLILTLAVAMLAFTFSQYQRLQPDNVRSIRISIILFGISTFFGLYISIWQSEAYRLYRVISRKIEQTAESKGSISLREIEQITLS